MSEDTVTEYYYFLLLCKDEAQVAMETQDIGDMRPWVID